MYRSACAGHALQVRVEQRAEFILGGEVGQDVDLGFVADLLGIQPTKLWRQGEELRSGGRRQRSCWIWETEEVVGWDSEALVTQVLDRFTPLAEVIREARKGSGLLVQVGLVVSMYGDLEPDDAGELSLSVSTPALAFTSETIRKLGLLDASFDIDQYVIAPDDATESAES
jgi:hypothetical protein